MEVISPGVVSAWLFWRKKTIWIEVCYKIRYRCSWIKMMPSRCMVDSSFQNVAAVKKYIRFQFKKEVNSSKYKVSM